MKRGYIYIYYSLDSFNELGWISAFQNHAKFCGEDLNWRVLIKQTNFEDLLPFLLPDGVPLNRIVNLDLLSPIRSQGWSSNGFARSSRARVLVHLAVQGGSGTLQNS